MQPTEGSKKGARQSKHPMLSFLAVLISTMCGVVWHELLVVDNVWFAVLAHAQPPYPNLMDVNMMFSNSSRCLNHLTLPEETWCVDNALSKEQQALFPELSVSSPLLVQGEGGKPSGPRAQPQSGRCGIATSFYFLRSFHHGAMMVSVDHCCPHSHLTSCSAGKRSPAVDRIACVGNVHLNRRKWGF